jgi:hypothetical protein
MIMKPRILLAMLAALAFSPLALAQGTVDCSKSRNPDRCEARQKARAACHDKRGAERRRCVQDQMPPPDCGKSMNPGHCKSLQTARDACKDKIGVAHRQCMEAQPGLKP